MSSCHVLSVTTSEMLAVNKENYFNMVYTTYSCKSLVLVPLNGTKEAIYLAMS